MKLDQYNRKVFTVGGETTAFTATMNGAAFAILSDAIYQYKLTAIVRELACNAYDSHLEAGKAEVPFTIALPNHISPNLVISDEGIGLDDDGVRKVFASYFNSTKTSSDEVTGGMGIGAKSVFSYSNTFSIIARKNGVERIYNAFIGNAGVPQVQIVSEGPTNAVNGVSIQIPIKANDFQLVEAEAAVIAAMFKTIPTVTGKTNFKLVRDDVYAQIEANGYAKISRYNSSRLYTSHRIYALMGNVLYPLPYSIFSSLNSIVEALHNSDEALIFPFNIGEVTPAASRESLSLSEKNSEFVVSKINAVLERARTQIQAELDCFEHPVAAYSYLLTRVGRTWASQFKFKGKQMNHIAGAKFNVGRFCGLKFVCTADRRRMIQVQYADSITVAEIADQKSVLVYQKTCPKKGTTERDRNSYYRELYSRNRTSVVMEFGRELSANRRARLEEYLGISNLTYISDDEVRAHVEEKKKHRRKKEKPVSEKTDTTIYAREVIGSKYVKSVYNVDVSVEGISYYWIDSDAANNLSFVDPEVFVTEDNEVRYIVRNEANKKKIERFGIESYQSLIDKFVRENQSDIAIYLTFQRISNLVRRMSAFEVQPAKAALNRVIRASKSLQEEVKPVFAKVGKFLADNSQLNSKLDLVFQSVNLSDVNREMPTLTIYDELSTVLESIERRYAVVVEILDNIPSYCIEDSMTQKLVDLVEENLYYQVQMLEAHNIINQKKAA